MADDNEEFQVWAHNLGAARDALHDLKVYAGRCADTWNAAAERHYQMWVDYQAVCESPPDDTGLAAPTDSEILGRIEAAVDATNNLRRITKTTGQDLLGSVATHASAARKHLAGMQGHLATHRTRRKEWDKAAKHVANGKATQDVADGARDRYEAATMTLREVVPKFISAFDDFLTRLVSEISQLGLHLMRRYKAALEDLAARFPPLDTSQPIAAQWRSQFMGIMPAAEAMSLIGGVRRTAAHPDVENVKDKVTTVPSPVRDNNWFQWLGGHGRIESFHWHKMHDDAGFFWTPATPHGIHHRPRHRRQYHEYVIAEYDYNGDDDSDLFFRRGDHIRVLDRGTDDDPNWWRGIAHGREGLFPCNYVRELSGAEATPRSPSAASASRFSEHGDLSKTPEDSSQPQESFDDAETKRESGEFTGESNVWDEQNGEVPDHHSEAGQIRRVENVSDDDDNDEHAPPLPARHPHELHSNAQDVDVQQISPAKVQDHQVLDVQQLSFNSSSLEPTPVTHSELPHGVERAHSDIQSSPSDHQSIHTNGESSGNVQSAVTKSEEHPGSTPTESNFETNKHTVANAEEHKVDGLEAHAVNSGPETGPNGSHGQAPVSNEPVQQPEPESNHQAAGPAEPVEEELRFDDDIL